MQPGLIEKVEYEELAFLCTVHIFYFFFSFLLCLLAVEHIILVHRTRSGGLDYPRSALPTLQLSAVA
jgi:hypothetical protein